MNPEKEKSRELIVRIPFQDEVHILMSRWCPNFDTTSEKTENNKIYCIEYGSKTLLLFIDDDGFETGIVNNGKQKLKEDTSIVYSKARELMQTEVDQKRKEMHYNFDTKNNKLIIWAKEKGQTIFNWESIYFNEKNNNLFCVAKIYPTE